MTESKSAIVFGATGACGKDLINELESDARYHRVVAIVRRDVAFQGQVETVVIPSLSAHALTQLDISADSVFCCLGTTIKQAGSQRAFREVDEHLVNATIDLAERIKAKHFHLISAAGANPSSMFFYSRIKAKTEAHLKNSNILKWTIYRPSLLKRKSDGEFRFAERIGEWLMAPLKWIPGLKRFAPVETRIIAQSMLARDQQEEAPYPHWEEGGSST